MIPIDILSKSLFLIVIISRRPTNLISRRPTNYKQIKSSYFEPIGGLQITSGSNHLIVNLVRILKNTFHGYLIEGIVRVNFYLMLDIRVKKM